MIDLRKFIDLDALQKIQDQFSEATGLAAIAVDGEGKYLTKGSNFTDFCMKHTRKNEEGAKRCQKCDAEGSGTYYCHAGLMDFSTDIIVHGEKAGAIIGGQVLPGVPDENKFRDIARELGIPENDYLAALKKVPVRSESMIRASAEMLGNVVNQLVNLEYMKTVTQKRNDILDVENILSINASIEAARAGEAGVGFAVVAREFGEISKNSGGVYQRIHELVGSINTSVSKLTGTI